MKIPKEFMNILDTDMELSGIVRTTVSHFDCILQESRFEFFPEYTKHDSSHVEAVLVNAVNLIGESLCLLNVRDTAVLILSILAHDLGMHITLEGFKSLLKIGNQKLIKHIDKCTWEEEWNKYLLESKKWSGDKRQQIFGKRVLAIRDPLKDESEFMVADKLLIGEFIRRHHNRIAHEIVSFGFPLANNEYLPFADNLDFEVKDIIGFIARSHGMHLRSTFSYLLVKHHDYRTPYNIKAIYHMVVLRIADYIHITSERAPFKKMQISVFSSPVSVMEWNLHQSIKDINQNHEDPETLFVNARPKNSMEFLKIKTLLKNIQSEMDLSWAILGEVYGRYRELNKLKISLRRIRSNLENECFTDSLLYLPEEVRFNSDPEIIKLLVSPLYGEKPSYGVRELIQNALDACREREYYLKSRSRKKGYTPEVKVCIIREDSDHYFQIEDNGIGMSAEVIVNYFFKAGSSYRNNNDWKMQFMENGCVQVARSGRFGVGVLAAFLIGERIEVTTRNVESEKGFSFSASLDDTQIEVSTAVEGSVGTTVRIKMNERSVSKFRDQVERNYLSSSDEPAWYAWYLLDEPSVSYCFPADWGQDGFNKYHITTCVNDWKSLKIEGYESIIWKFKGLPSNQSSHTTILCNGIIIPNGFNETKFFYSYPSMSRMPSLIVFDNDGKLPLILTRDKLDNNGELPFEKELFQDMFLDMLGKLITCEMNASELIGNTICFKHPIIESKRNDDQQGSNSIGEGTLLLSQQGYCLPYAHNLRKLNANKIVHVWLKRSKIISNDIWTHLDYATIFEAPLSYSNTTVLNELYKLSFSHDYRIVSKRIYLPKRLGTAIMNGEIRMRKDILYKLRIEKTFENIVCIVMNNPPPATIDESFFNSENGLKIDSLIEVFIVPKKFRKFNENDKKKIDELNIFVEETLDECFGNEIFIPYKFMERKRRFPRAFDFLKDHI